MEPTGTPAQSSIQIQTAAVSALVTSFQAKVQEGEIENLDQAGLFLDTWLEAMEALTQ